MKCQILHESRGRMRVHLACAHMTLHQADVLEYYLKNIAGVLDVKVFDRTCDAVVSFQENRTAGSSRVCRVFVPEGGGDGPCPRRTRRAL